MEWISRRDDLRSSLQVATVVGLASTIVAAGFGAVTQQYGRQGGSMFIMAGEFGAVSALLAFQPFTGETLKCAVQDSLGTLAGGVVGLGVCLLAVSSNHQLWEDVIIVASLTVATFLLSWGFKCAGWTYASNVACMAAIVASYSAFFSSTAVFSAILTASRIAGIMVGVGLSFLVSFFCFPVSATNKVVEEHQQALVELARFGRCTWEAVPAPLLQQPAQNAATADTAKIPQPARMDRLSSFGTWVENVSGKLSVFSSSVNSTDRAASGRIEDERRITDSLRNQSRVVLNHVNAAKVASRTAAHERLFSIGRLSGFLPVWPAKSKTSLPRLACHERIGDAVGEVVRIVWNLNSTLCHSFEDTTLLRIARALPPLLMKEIQEAAIDAIEKVRDVGPSSAFESPGFYPEAQDAIGWLDKLVSLLLELTMYHRHQRVAAEEAASSGLGGGQPLHGAAFAPRSIPSVSRRHPPPMPQDGQPAGGQSPSEKVPVDESPFAASGVASDGGQTSPQISYGTEPPPVFGGFGAMHRPTQPQDAKEFAADQRRLIKRLGGADIVEIRASLFDDDPKGFIEEVRWVSFVYELRFYTDAVSNLLSSIMAACDGNQAPTSESQKTTASDRSSSKSDVEK